MANVISRQNTLFVSEDWIQIYQAIENVDFRAYDFDNLVQAIMDHLQQTFPEEFNDWIASSEFIMKVEVLAWLSQNIAFRIDLNARENFLATAERRDSLIKLAENVAFKVNRVTSASGPVRIDTIRTDQPIIDSSGINIQNTDIVWNDPRNEDWLEQFILIMNATFTRRTQFGRPLVSSQNAGIQKDQYVFNSAAPQGGAYPFSTSVNGITLTFDTINLLLDKDTGVVGENIPDDTNAYNTVYVQDGKGLASDGTGFFLEVVQGNMAFQDIEFVDPLIIRVVNIDVPNINNDDFFIQEINVDGTVLSTWTQVDDVFGEGISFDASTDNSKTIYELDTLLGDTVRVRFGDGKFGAIPQGTFRFWYRTANPQPQAVKPDAIQNQLITIPYVSDGVIYYLSVSFSLKDQLINAAATESNFDIRTRANRIFYTQNRMVTGQDYNAFFLKDNAIQKVKVVNRTYAGHSRFSKLTDPTGLYQNVKVMADDGRFYKDTTITNTQVSADIAIVPTSTLINNSIAPLISKPDKNVLYINDYPPMLFDDTNADPRLNGNGDLILQPYSWAENSIVAGESRGNIKDNAANILPVGTGNTTSNLQYVDVDAVVTTGLGVNAYVDRIVDDGTGAGSIILRDIVQDLDSIDTVLPAMRTIFSGPELANIEQQVLLKLDFGISWDYVTLSWNIITFENMDKTSQFSLANQNDTSGAGLDASWMIMLEYIPGGIGEDLWSITDRGFGFFWESAREVDFFFVNNSAVLNPETGVVEHDTVTILDCNETRDSERRICVADDPAFIPNTGNDLFVADVLRYPDGYVNTDGIFVTPADLDSSGFYDNPFLFSDFIIEDGVTDLVLWRLVDQQGFTVPQPINETTTPKGSYGFQGADDVSGYPVLGDPIKTKVIYYSSAPATPCKTIPYVSGDIHYDQTTSQWLIANGTNQTTHTEGEWELAVDQNQFQYKIGRDDLSFKWVHYSPDSVRIDPSVSNVMDVYILTALYDVQIRSWLTNNEPLTTMPVAPTSETLRTQFQDFDDFKTMSDSIIFHSTRYLLLFGEQAIPELQATFKVVQTQGSQVSENNIRLRVLAAINTFFEAENWDFGETFYFTELAAFIHKELNPDIQSVVIVPRSNDQRFGAMFQVRSEPDQLFASAASAEDVKIVTSLTDAELKTCTIG